MFTAQESSKIYNSYCSNAYKTVESMGWGSVGFELCQKLGDVAAKFCQMKQDLHGPQDYIKFIRTPADCTERRLHRPTRQNIDTAMHGPVYKSRLVPQSIMIANKQQAANFMLLNTF